MGYLNYNLEKIASVVEVEMEKRALSVHDLLRMARSAAEYGPSRVTHLAKRLMQRNKAIDKVMPSRLAALDDANAMEKLIHKLLGSKHYTAGRNVLKAKQRIPGGKPIGQYELFPPVDIADTVHAPVAGKLSLYDLADL